MRLLRRFDHRKHRDPIEVRVKRGLAYAAALGGTVAVGAAVALAGQAL